MSIASATYSVPLETHPRRVAYEIQLLSDAGKPLGLSGEQVPADSVGSSGRLDRGAAETEAFVARSGTASELFTESQSLSLATVRRQE